MDYANFDWVLEDEKVPKKELAKFFSKLFTELTGAVEKEEEPEEEKDAYTKDLRVSLLENEYNLFSINENGDVFLLSSDKDTDNDLFLTGSHAAKLMLVLKEAVQKRAEKLSKYFGNL